MGNTPARIYNPRGHTSRPLRKFSEMPDVPDQESGQGSVPSCFGRFWDIPVCSGRNQTRVVERRGGVVALNGRRECPARREITWPRSGSEVVDPIMPHLWVSASRTEKQNNNASSGQCSLSTSFPICKWVGCNNSSVMQQPCG